MLKTSIYLQKRWEWYNEHLLFFHLPSLIINRSSHLLSLYYYYLLKLLRVSCIHHNLSALNVYPWESNILVHNHSTFIKFKKFNIEKNIPIFPVVPVSFVAIFSPVQDPVQDPIQGHTLHLVFLSFSFAEYTSVWVFWFFSNSWIPGYIFGRHVTHGVFCLRVLEMDIWR